MLKFLSLNTFISLELTYFVFILSNLFFVLFCFRFSLFQSDLEIRDKPNCQKKIRTNLSVTVSMFPYLEIIVIETLARANKAKNIFSMRNIARFRWLK